MSSSASAIVDACVSAIAGISRVGTGNAHRRGYDIMDRATSQCCFRVRPVRGDMRFRHFSTTSDTCQEDVYIRAEGFVKLLDNYDDWHDEQDSLLADMKTAFNATQTLGGIVDWAVLETWDIPDMEYDVNGQVWQPMNFTIHVYNI